MTPPQASLKLLRPPRGAENADLVGVDGPEWANDGVNECNRLVTSIISLQCSLPLAGCSELIAVFDNLAKGRILHW